MYDSLSPNKESLTGTNPKVSTISTSFLKKNIVNLVYWFSSKNDINSGKSLNKYDKKLNNLRDSQNFLLKDSINLRDNKLEIFSFRKD